MEKKLHINQEYLYLPIKAKEKEQLIEIFEDNNDNLIKIMELRIPVVEDKEGNYSNEYIYDYKAKLPVNKWKGKTLVLRGNVPQSFWKEVECTSFFSIKNEERPKVHFTAETGWINDPNGLVYSDGVYHLYFQYNPFNISWQNMSWGHAISKDLLHWEQQDTVLLPDEYGTIFSGCGIKNDRALLDLPEDALIFFYTAAGDNKPWGKENNFTQKVAYSLDSGKTLIKTSEPYLDTIASENRDPKIFWHEETEAYIMTLWLEKNDFAIFRSIDLRQWELTDRITLEEAWECPDLVKLYDDEGKSYWMFWSADGFYYWGEFDGYKFQTDGKRHLAYFNQVPYAAQTYSGVKNRTISIPWIRIQNRGKLYTGAMGIPREFKVKITEKGKYLSQLPVRELEVCRKCIWQKESNTSQIFKYAPLRVEESQKQRVLQLEITLESIHKKQVTWEINGTSISYAPSTGEFKVNECAYHIGKNQTNFSLLIDSYILEVTADHGIMTGIFELNKEILDIQMDLEGISQLDVYEII